MNKTLFSNNFVMPIALPGIKFIFIAIFITLLFFMVGFTFLGWLSIFITLFICWFFRDPERVIPDSLNAVVSPADGKVIVVEEKKENEFTNSASIKLSIFMNVFNVHVNRVPFDGVIEDVIYIPGKFINASFDKASKHNERNGLIIKTDSGASYTVVQIAGLIARRIVCNVKKGDVVKKGIRYGMICFGSRVDLYLPLDSNISVKVGQNVKAGSTILAYLKDK